MEAKDKFEGRRKKLNLMGTEVADVTPGTNCLMNIEKDIHNNPHEEENTAIYEGLDFVDDKTGKGVDFKMAIEAHKLEMKFFRDMKAYSKVQRSEAYVNGSKVITTKWLDINKGDDQEPNYRSRFVGREL